MKTLPGGGVFGLAVALCLGLYVGLHSTASASGVVASPTQSSLAAAMAGGGTVTFGFNGTIYLTNTITISNDTILDATGKTVAISGSNAVQIFIVNTNTSLTLTNLTLENGLAQAALAYSAQGAAIWNQGMLQIVECSFISNVASGASEPQGYQTDGDGGAIYNTGTMTVFNSQFSGNAAVGGNANQGEIQVLDFGPGANGCGGVLFNSGQAACVNCVFSNNYASGGAGAAVPAGGEFAGYSGGEANGGAVCNDGTFIISNCIFAQNAAESGQGGAGAGGVAGLYGEYSNPPANGGNGGNAVGGGFCCLGGSAILVNDTFWSNSALGGTGGTGGGGIPAYYNIFPAGPGANGGNGGDGMGGAIGTAGGAVLATNITAASNLVSQGPAGAAGPGGAAGGPSGEAYPAGRPGSAGSSGTAQADSLDNSSGTILIENSLFCPNAPSDIDLYGSIVDAGYNLDSGLLNPLTNSTSLNGINPDLAPLGDYGGPTPTMALPAGSPAIDAANPKSFPATDQRGVTRPVGAAPDIGAFEYSGSYLVSGAVSGFTLTMEVQISAGPITLTTTNHGHYSLQLPYPGNYTVTPVSPNYLFVPSSIVVSQQVQSNAMQSNANFQAYKWDNLSLDRLASGVANLTFAATHGGTYRTLSSSDLVHWSPVATNTVSTDSYFQVAVPANAPQGEFYKAVSP